MTLPRTNLGAMKTDFSPTPTNGAPPQAHHVYHPTKVASFQIWISIKEYHLGGFKRRFDSKIDQRGVVESNSANNAGLEC